MTEQVRAMAQHSNCWAALISAAGAALDARSAQQRADGNAAIGQIGIEQKEYTSWTIHLNPSAQYVSHPRSYQSWWMSKAQLRSIIGKETRALSTKFNRLYAQEAVDSRMGIVPESLTQQIQSVAGTLSYILFHGKDLSTASELGNVLNRLVSKKDTSAIATSYLNHKVTSVTIPELEDHIAELARGSKKSAQMLAAQDILRQAQQSHAMATACANQGVEAAQATVTQDANLAKQDVLLVKSINETLQACSVGSRMS